MYMHMHGHKLLPNPWMAVFLEEHKCDSTVYTGTTVRICGDDLLKPWQEYMCYTIYELVKLNYVKLTIWNAMEKNESRIFMHFMHISCFPVNKAVCCLFLDSILGLDLFIYLF